MSGKRWTKEEIQYLEEKWGTSSMKVIAAKLGRTIDAVKVKAQKLGFTDARLSFDGITVCQLSKALDKTYPAVKNWIVRYGLPARKKIFCKESRVWVIDYQDFWKWAEQHKELLNLAKMEPLTLGPEPNWVKTKRRADQLRSQKTWQSVGWTTNENSSLKQMVKMSGMTYPKLAAHFNRSEASIKRRLYDLGIKFRPERLNNHIKYTSEDVELLSTMARQGYGYETIAKELGKSALGVRGKLERMNFDFMHREFREAID